jgi:hypothetical protein
MTITLNRSLDKIVTAIQRKGGVATLREIKRSIAEFNQSGGAEKLKQCLTDLVAHGILTLCTNKSSNGQSIESYRLANSSSSSPSSSNAHLKITGTFDIAIEGLHGLGSLLRSLINPDNSERIGSDENSPEVPDDTDDDEVNELPPPLFADEEDSFLPDDDDLPELLPPDIDDTSDDEDESQDEEEGDQYDDDTPF